MTYDDNNGIVGNDNGIEAEYVVSEPVVSDPAYVAPVVEGVERSWLSRNWWLPLLAALALATLLIWLANRNQTCTIQGSALTITADQENAIMARFDEILPQTFSEANRADALNAARNVCAAHLAGNAGDTLNTHISDAFNFVGHELDTDALNSFSSWVRGETWCHC